MKSAGAGVFPASVFYFGIGKEVDCMKNLVFPYEDVPSAGAPFVGGNVNRAALARFLTRAKERAVDVHAFQVWRDNELAVRMSLPPYDCVDKRHYFSLSKSFVSTAIGLACDEGLLTTDTRIVDLFPDKLPEHVSENLSKCLVHHVLSMNSGVEKGTSSVCFASDDMPKAFLASDFVYEPGTHYCYDTGATGMLAAIVKKVTGMSALDYLDVKLFRYLGIRDVYWDRTSDGTIQGGIGLHASCDDAAKLGLLYLNRGLWNGRRLLSEAWIDAASSLQSQNGPHDWIDWRSGYGYQFWMSSRGGYRGDGAFGQYCFILPDRGIVAAALCEAENLQHAVDIVHEMALELFDEPFGEGDVERMAEEFYAMPRTETPVFDPPRYFKMEENPFGITYIKLDTAGDDFVFAVSDGFSLTNIRCGNGVWRHNRASFEQTFLPNAPAFPVQTSERTAGIAAAYTNENGVLRAELRCRYSPHHLTVTFAPGADGLTVSVSGLYARRAPLDTLVGVEV